MLEELFTLAGKAHNNAEQQALFGAEKQIKDNAQRIQTGFLSILAEQLKRWQNGEPRLTDDDKNQSNDLENDLSLVQHDDFEDWLLTKVTSTHLQSHLSHSSFEIRQRLDVVSDARAENCFNPLGPNIVTEAFRKAISDLTIDQDARRIAFEVFEQVAGQQLQGAYQSMIREIDVPLSSRHRPRSVAPRPAPQEPDASSQEATEDDRQITPRAPGVSGNSAPQPANGNRSPQATGTAGGYVAPTYDSSIDAFRRHQEEAKQAYSNIRNLLSLRYQKIENGLSGGAGAPADSEVSAQPQIPFAEPTKVSDTLQSLWQENNSRAGHLRQDLESALAKQEMALPAESREAIDTLEHVTQNLVGNEQIPEFIKPFINDLEQPLSLMMLKDPSMIFNPEHPGRVILNALSKLGRLTTTGQDMVGEQLQELLQGIDSNADDIEQQLLNLLSNINNMVSDAERRARVNADRVAQAAEGEHRVEQARTRIARLISRDTSGRVLPAVVMEWLEQGWKPLLTLIYLRETSESKRFRGAVKLYRQVLVLFNPGNAGRTELQERFRPLLKLMRHELDQLNGQRPEHTQWHDEIALAAQQHLQSGQIEEVVEVPEREEEQEQRPEGRGVRRALNLQVGDWLLLTEQDQSVSVVWMADDGSKFACVNHSGMKVVDFTLEALAQALEDGTVKRLYEQEESAVDQSLDALVQQIYNDLSAQANTDALTEINTRQHFMRHLKEEVLKAHRSNLTHTLCMIDIDQFKLINSEYGVEGGDECLKGIGKILNAEAEHHNDCARMGSNEFAILFQHSDMSSGEEKARELKKLLEQTDIISGDHRFRVHVSMGLSELNYQIGDETDLVEYAESACLLAKEKGGSRVYRYVEDDNARIKRDEFMSWANKLNQALEGDQLKLLCQPVTAIQDAEKSLRQYEVIISIEGENGTQIPPLEYLQAAEHYSRMYLVDRWTLEQLIIAG